MNYILRWSFILVLIVGLVVMACSVQKSPVTGNKRAYGYNWEQELQIGKEADGQIQQEYGVYDDEELSRYVEQVGEDVLAVSHMRRDDTEEQYRETEFTFRVLNSPVVNAFALPGGYIYLTRGLLSHLNNEAQLAVVLGHEIGHVAARHASQRAFEQNLAQIALVGGAVAGQEIFGLPGQSLLDLGGTAAQLMFLRYGRDDERESDRLGVEYSAMQGYEAAEGAEFFTSLKRISEESGQSIPSFLSTHPDPAERENTIPELAREYAEEGYEQTIDDEEEYMNMIDGIIYGENPREGFTENGIFYHPDLEFQFPYPEGWTLVNQPSQVVMFNEGQDAVISFSIDSEADNARGSVQNFLNQEGIETVREGEANRSLPSYEATARAETENGDLRVYTTAIEFGGNVYSFLSYTTENQFGDYESRFRRVADGFEELTDRDKLNVEPVRLELVQADRSGAFESFLPDNLPMEIDPEEIAIVNQVELDEEIEEGTWLKIPRN